jgi:eukaryotic-like serine/threonine-protein kinase
LLAGSPPFGTGRNAIVKIIMSEQKGVNLNKPTWFGSHASSGALEADLWNLIMSCLKPAPKDRPTANEVVEACDRMCYATSKRSLGTIDSFPGRYPNGAKGNFGFIADKQGSNHFFHGTDFFGAEGPKSGQQVSFSEYPGAPKPRVCPVLLLRS